MAGNEPAGRYAEPVEQFHQPRHPNFAGKKSTGNIAGRILAAIGAEPTRDRIDVDADRAEYFFLAAAAGSGRRSRASRRFSARRSYERTRLIARSAGGAIAGANRAKRWTGSVIIGHGAPPAY